MASRSQAEGLFSGMFARGEAAARATERALLAAMVDVEMGLIRALVEAGIAPEQAAREVDTVDAGELDIDELGRESAQHGTPVPALIRALRALLGDSVATPWLHVGATSQDIIDTAIMLVARRAVEPLLDDLARGAGCCAELADDHRGSLQAGRTLLQQAAPVTFGLKAAGWLTAIDAARHELARVRAEALQVQLGGAAGTLAALGERGLEVMAALATELGLREPDLPWHTNRVAPARLASTLGIALGVMAKVARDVVLLAQTEVDEGGEAKGDGHGGSSTMLHKRNPVDAIAVLACAQRAPGLVATILASMAQEHERAAGSWQAEWEPLLELLRLAGSAGTALRSMLDGLEPRTAKMRANLELTHGLLMSESVATALADAVGRARAEELVRAGASRAAQERRELGEVLLDEPDVAAAIDRERLEQALAPENYLGVTDRLIERALAAHKDRGGA